MVTIETPRIPHAVQAGPTTTILWLTGRAISLIVSVAPILLLPVAGRHLIFHEGVPLPDASLSIGLVVVYAALLAAGGVKRWINSALTMRIPGQMGAFGSRDVIGSTRVPEVISALVVLVAEIAAAFYSATHATGDHGATALFLMLAGVLGVVIFARKAVESVMRRNGGWQGDIAVNVIAWLVSPVALFFMGRFLAPRGALTDPAIVGGLVSVVVATYILIWAVSFLTKKASPTTGLRGLAEGVSDGVLSRMNAAPTMTDRIRGTRVALLVIYIALGAAIVLWVVSAVLL